MTWNPTEEFFSKEAAENITWKMKRYTAFDFPLKFFECKMQGFETEVSGYAVADKTEIATKKAFAEAWERLWFHKQSKESKEISNTSGFAAGSTNEMAQQNAKEELIERAVLMRAWQSQAGWQKGKFSTLKCKYIQFALYLKGWSIEVYDLDSSQGTVKCLFAKHTKLGLIFDSCFANDKSQCEKKLLYSILKNIYLPKLEPLERLAEYAKPLDHARFYADPENLPAFNFLKSKENVPAYFELENPELLQTTLLYKAGNFPAVALCQHPSWPKISWGRASIQGKNPCPHPLA